MSADLTNPIFTDEAKAREYLEAVRWANGRPCPHCGEVDNSTKLEGQSHRPGLYQCNGCRKPFSVTVGTVYERSHIPLHKWLLATHLLSSSKKGMSAHQIHRMLGITYKSAWFMCHRIRLSMVETNPSPLGGEGQIVEADETFIGPSEIVKKEDGSLKRKRGGSSKRVVVSLVERGGRVRSTHAPNVKGTVIRKIVTDNADKASRLITDDAPHYRIMGEQFAKHDRIKHSTKIYGKGDVSTNVIEGFFSIFKRGMIGTYQHCGEQHLQRYLTEFDFRYNGRKLSDSERALIALTGIEGKRLTYRRPEKRS